MRVTGLRDSLLLILLCVVAVASVSDLADDIAHGSDALHLLGELVALLLAGGAVVWLLREHRGQQGQLAALRAELAEAAARVASSDASVKAQRRQLGEFIHAQFVTWGLTESEREVGWLLLKGLSLKEIAGLRSTVEKTVRQQASSIYQKAAVSGRHAFAAWFLEDYL